MRYLLQDGLPDPAAWSIPANLRIEDGLLRYNYARRRQGTDAQSALDEFIDLVGAKPTRLLGFVKKWGPLRLAPELDQDGAGWNAGRHGGIEDQFGIAAGGAEER